jgi:hypothetical protein
MARRAPGATQELALRTLRHLLGTGRWWSVVLVVLFLVTLGWFTDSLFEWLTDVGPWLKGRPVDDWWPIHRVVAVIAFPTYLMFLWLAARHARKRLRPRVRQDDQPPRARGLVLFLSALKGDQADEIRLALESGLRGLEDFRHRFERCSWRMPLEALAYHQGRLRQVLVLVSADEPAGAGSVGQFALFRALALSLFPASDLRVEPVSVCDPCYGDGVDFEDMQALSAAVDDAYEYLLGLGLRDSEALIDVTGGQKPTAIAGAAVALAEGRCLQYVSTRDYRVRVYDVTYGD